jgi:hypothetical protein
MMMMGFGGMMNAGAMGGMQNNPYMMQQQMGMQQPQQARVGVSQFPPPVTEAGNIYDPKKKEKDSFFKLPNMSNTNWGDVAYNISLALGAGAVAGAGVGIIDNFINAPGLGAIYEIKDGGKVTAQQRFEASDGYSGRVAQTHITGDGVNATVKYEYAPERGRIKRFFKWGNDHDLLGLTVKHDKGTINLERSGWLGNDYKLALENNGEMIYRRQKNGDFVAHKAIINQNEVLHFDKYGKVKGTVPNHITPADYKLHNQLGLPEGAKIQTKMPNASTLTHLEGKAIDGRLLKGLGGWALGAAAASAVIAGGYTAWKTSQPKSSEEILRSLPRQGVEMPPQGALLPATDPRRIEQEWNLRQQG